MPKGTDPSYARQTCLNDVAALMNNRPEMTPGWNTAAKAIGYELAAFGSNAAPDMWIRQVLAVAGGQGARSQSSSSAMNSYPIAYSTARRWVLKNSHTRSAPRKDWMGRLSARKAGLPGQP